MALSDTARGILFMCVAMASFTVNDALIKIVTVEMPLMQAIALRGVVSVIGLGLMARASGAYGRRLSRGDASQLGWRTLAEVGSTLTFLTALLHLPLANLSAIMQSLPLAVTLAAAVFLAEPVGWRRLAAIGVGFIGVLFIVRPGTGAFNIWSVVGLISVACVVARDLLTRRLAAHLPAVLVALCAAGAVTVMGLVGVIMEGGFVPVSPYQALLICLCAGALISGYIFIVKAMRMGDIATVAPFRYTALVWAILLGWLFFSSLPDLLTWVGAGLIVASGLFTLTREARLRRARAAGAPV